MEKIGCRPYFQIVPIFCTFYEIILVQIIKCVIIIVYFDIFLYLLSN